MTTLETIQPKIEKLARMYSAGDQQTADDLVATVNLYIIERGFENETEAFILQQAKWQALGLYDKASTYNKYVESVEFQFNKETEGESDEELDWIEILPNDEASPEDAMIEAEFAADLADAIESLDLKSRKIVSLLLDGFSFSEIAAKMGVSRSAISQKMNTVREFLDDVLRRDN